MAKINSSARPLLLVSVAAVLSLTILNHMILNQENVNGSWQIYETIWPKQKSEEQISDIDGESVILPPELVESEDYKDSDLDFVASSVVQDDFPKGEEEVSEPFKEVTEEAPTKDQKPASGNEAKVTKPADIDTTPQVDSWEIGNPGVSTSSTVGANDEQQPSSADSATSEEDERSHMALDIVEFSRETAEVCPSFSAIDEKLGLMVCVVQKKELDVARSYNMYSLSDVYGKPNGEAFFTKTHVFETGSCTELSDKYVYEKSPTYERAFNLLTDKPLSVYTMHLDIIPRMYIARGVVREIDSRDFQVLVSAQIPSRVWEIVGYSPKVEKKQAIIEGDAFFYANELYTGISAPCDSWPAKLLSEVRTDILKRALSSEDFGYWKSRTENDAWKSNAKVVFINNQEEAMFSHRKFIHKALIKKFGLANVKIYKVNVGQYNPDTAIKMFSKADIVIGFGDLLSSMIFMRPQAIVIEVSREWEGDLYENLAAKLELQYFKIKDTSKNSQRLRVDDATVITAIEEAMG